jgi:transcriptional regulator
MPRIYSEIRITHKDADTMQEFEEKLYEQVERLGLNSVADYIRLIVSLDAASGIISNLKEADK